MTTAFQYIFDRASAISINKRAVVAQTTTRDQTIRTVSRGGQVWRFDVTPPAGLPWSEARPYLEAIDAADRFTAGNVQINNVGYNSWLTPYQGTAVNSTGFYLSATQGYANATITVSPTISSGYRFRAGDIVQLGNTGHVYTVTADVAHNSTAVTLNRPVIDTTANVNLRVGPNVIWNVICVDIPDWTISDVNVVTFDGSFKFVENLL
jgi:hypothetical protein